MREYGPDIHFLCPEVFFMTA